MIYQPGNHGDRKRPELEPNAIAETRPFSAADYADAMVAETERIARDRAAANGEDTNAPGWLFGALAMSFVNGTIAEAARNLAAKGIVKP